MEIGDRGRAAKSVEKARGLSQGKAEAKLAPEQVVDTTSAALGYSGSSDPPESPRGVQRRPGDSRARGPLLGRASPSEILYLQRTVGNRAILRMMVQAKGTASSQGKVSPSSEASGAAGEHAASRHAPSVAPRFGKLATASLQRATAASPSQPRFGRSDALRRQGLAVQRVPGGGTAPSRSVAFDKRDIAADGAATAQARARGFGGAAVEWEPVEPSYGSTIGKDSGLITAGKNLPARKERLTVKATSKRDARASARGWITLWEEKLFKAKQEYKDFIEGSPYEIQSFKAGTDGNFDAKYFAASKRLDVTVKVKFDFPADAPAATETPRQRRARERRWAALAKTYKAVVKRAWSRRYSFRNTREPQEVWGRLSPVRVVVNVVEVKANAAGILPPRHYTVEISPANQGSANVTGDVTQLGTALNPEKVFNPEAKEGELIKLNRLIPVITFPNNSNAIPAGDVDKLQFLATYLKRIRIPRYTLVIEGSAADETVAWKVRQRANARAGNVRRELRGAGLTYHGIQLGRKSNGTAVTITPKVSDKFVNYYDVTSHEFGHMIGLGDEYPQGYFKDATGHYVKYVNPYTGAYTWKKTFDTKSSHYGLVEKALGAKYAEKTQTLFVPTGDANDPNRPQTSDEADTSIMGSGSDVRIQHYVTFWEALAATTSQKANVPTPKLGQDDWKFVGG